MSTSEADCYPFGLAAKTLKKQKVLAQKLGGRAKWLDQEWTKPRPIDRKGTGVGRQRCATQTQTEISVVIALLTSV